MYQISKIKCNFDRSWGIHDEEIPAWQRAILKVAWPLLRKFLIKVLDVTKENAEDWHGGTTGERHAKAKDDQEGIEWS